MTNLINISDILFQLNEKYKCLIKRICLMFLIRECTCQHSHFSYQNY